VRTISTEVVFYTTDCPRCSVLKQKLTEHGVNFVENHSVDEMTALGLMQAPALMVDGNLLDFAQAVKWANEQ